MAMIIADGDCLGIGDNDRPGALLVVAGRLCLGDKDRAAAFFDRLFIPSTLLIGSLVIHSSISISSSMEK